MEVVLKFPDVDPLNPPVLTMTDVAFQYNPDKKIFNCVNLNANLESRICIVSRVLPIGFLFLCTKSLNQQSTMFPKQTQK